MTEPEGVLIGEKEMRERCGTCKKPMIMAIHLDTVSGKRNHYATCKQCKYLIKLKSS